MRGHYCFDAQTVFCYVLSAQSYNHFLTIRAKFQKEEIYTP
ncbi:Uncharacterized protein dnm_048480 [Desulfonema magnum]|uniref:Uncharacterized protein n=1 Tax=Desulfonema magnum TaxID=45655 RepID=A0A975BNI8_9BACT|nr:Uncharacterized protein dnm_048480 [Desulfonema magnum]